MSRFWGPSSETTEKVGGVSQVFPWSFTPSSNNCLTFLRVRQSCCNKMVWFKKSWISWFDTGHNTYFLKTVSMNMSIFEISIKNNCFLIILKDVYFTYFGIYSHPTFTEYHRFVLQQAVSENIISVNVDYILCFYSLWSEFGYHIYRNNSLWRMKLKILDSYSTYAYTSPHQNWYHWISAHTCNSLGNGLVIITPIFQCKGKYGF